MLQNAMLWTAKRYRDFADKHDREGEDRFLTAFGRGIPMLGLVAFRKMREMSIATVV